jgi:hypothetical protein
MISINTDHTATSISTRIYGCKVYLRIYNFSPPTFDVHTLYMLISTLISISLQSQSPSPSPSLFQSHAAQGWLWSPLMAVSADADHETPRQWFSQGGGSGPASPTPQRRDHSRYCRPWAESYRSHGRAGGGWRSTPSSTVQGGGARRRSWASLQGGQVFEKFADQEGRMRSP